MLLSQRFGTHHCSHLCRLEYCRKQPTALSLSKGFSRFHSGSVFVCFVCLSFLFCFVSYCYFWPNSDKLTQISSKDQRRKRRKIPAMSGSLQVGKESSTASAAAFGAQGRDTTASTTTIQLVRKAWRCWWLRVSNGPTVTGFIG